MQPTADFFAQAQQCIESVVRPYRAKILAVHGDVANQLKADATPVTLLDTELEHLLKNALRAFDGSVGFEGEELGKSGDADTFWLVDPIDGTESFVRGLPYVRNMVTLISGGEPVFTLVYNVVLDELYTASKGGGTFKDGQRVHIAHRPLARSWMELAGPLADPAMQSAIRALRPKLNSFSVTRNFTAVADGRLDSHLIYKHGGNIWDFAPRAFLIKEAGARVANIGSEHYDYRHGDILMAHPEVFDELMAAIVSSQVK